MSACSFPEHDSRLTIACSAPIVCTHLYGHRFDRGLGGFEMDLRLRDHLAKLFNGQKKSEKDVRENHRAMAKLLKEAQRLKTVLSANADFMAQVTPCVETCHCHCQSVPSHSGGQLAIYNSPFKRLFPPGGRFDG